MDAAYVRCSSLTGHTRQQGRQWFSDRMMGPRVTTKNSFLKAAWCFRLSLDLAVTASLFASANMLLSGTRNRAVLGAPLVKRSARLSIGEHLVHSMTVLASLHCMKNAAWAKLHHPSLRVCPVLSGGIHSKGQHT